MAEAGSEFSSETGKLIAAWEHGGGDINAVRKQYDPLPEWPKGKSGLTIGMGYDLRYQNPGDLRRDWGGVLTEDQLKRLEDYSPTINAKGKQVAPKKAANQAAVVATKDINIRYEDAVKVFEDKILPRFEQQAYKTFPGLEGMDPYTKAAVVSMVYNRGASMGKKGTLRNKNFMDIKAAVIRKDTKAIEAALRAMKAEHKDPATSAGLKKRRESEAQEIENNQDKADWYNRRMSDPSYFDRA